MSHTHRCAACQAPTRCDGYRVGCVEDGDIHCIAEDDGPVVCLACGEDEEGEHDCE